MSWQTEQVIKHVNAVDDYKFINFDGNWDIIKMADVTDNFIEVVKKQVRFKDIVVKEQLKIVYTPLHGIGNIPMTKTLLLKGFTSLSYVNAQTITV